MRQGVDVVYESVGGEVFDAAVNNLATHGRLIVIGFTSGYQDGSGWTTAPGAPAGKRGATPLPAKILAKSLSLRGFFLNNFVREWKPHMGPAPHPPPVQCPDPWSHCTAQRDSSDSRNRRAGSAGRPAAR